MNQSDTNSAPRIAWQEPVLDILEAIIHRRCIVIIIMILGSIAGILRLASMPDVYSASAVAVLLPREKAMMDASIDTSSIETSDDRASRSSAGSLMLPPNPALYTTIIDSRAVLEEIARRFSDQLSSSNEVSNNDRSEEVIDKLRRMIRTTTTEEGIITIHVDSHSARLSADLANALFEQCEIASKSIERKLLIHQASHLDKALLIAEKRLTETEEKMSAFTSKMGLVNTDLQASNQLRGLRELQTERDTLEADLDALRLSYTNSAPEVIAVKARIATIERQSTLSQQNVVGSVGTADFGRVSIAYKSLEQKVRFERDMVSTLSTKSDIYRLRAEQPIGNLAIIRPANTPTRPAGPSKKRELGLALGLSMILSIGYCLLCQQWQSMRKDRDMAARTDDLIDQVIPNFKRFKR
ncbi:MAG: capsule polysaccharide export protein KpsE/RkpR [Lentimonas sp.]|jgi:capsule polysaccharide export protein KpsE/RkpR